MGLLISELELKAHWGSQIESFVMEYHSEKMKSTYIKKMWEEEKILFYLHFEGEYAIRQIEIQSGNLLLIERGSSSTEDQLLYDQKLCDLDLDEKDYISKDEFEEEWGRGS